MKSKQEDVLHKTEFQKIIKNSPKSNFEECVNPPSFSQSFFLDSTPMNAQAQFQRKENNVNEFVVENYNKWIDQLESTKAISFFSGRKKNSSRKQEFQLAIQIVYSINYLLRVTKSLFFLFCSFFLPSFILYDCIDGLEKMCYFLSLYHIVSFILFNICIYIEDRHQAQSIIKDAILNYNTYINLIVVLVISLQIVYKQSLIISILCFYYFQTGFKIIQTFAQLLLISKRKYHNHLAVLKIIVHYLFFLHLFSCILPEYEPSNSYLEKYYESLIINVNFFTFQSNSLIAIKDTSSVTVSQIAAYVMLLHTIDVIFQIRQDMNSLKQKIKFDVHMLQYYFWQHKGILLKKLRIYSQLSNRELTKEQKFQQKIIQKIYYQILKDSLTDLKILTKDFLKLLSEKVKIIRKQQELQNNQQGLHIVLQGNGVISFIGSGLRQYEQDLKDKIFGLIDCFQPNLSDLQLTMKEQFLILFISIQDFHTCLKTDRDVETFHVIKNKIIFDGDTSLIGFKCLICNGSHIIKRCQVVKQIFDFLNEDILENQRQMQVFRRNKNRRHYALNLFARKNKKSVSVTVDPSNESSDSSNDEFEIYPDELSGSHHVTEKNCLPVNSKGTITVQNGQEDFITEKYLLEQLKLSHRQISLQQPSIQPSSNPQTIELLRPDYRSFPLCASLYKFQDILGVDDIDVVKEYAYFYPEFNISYIISMLQN